MAADNRHLATVHDKPPTLEDLLSQKQLEALEAATAVLRWAARDAAVSLITDPSDIRNEGLGVYILDAETHEKGVAGKDFTLRPTYMSGAADSAHSVLVGTLTSGREAATEPPELDAIKCYQGSRTFAERLHRAYTDVALAGFMREHGELAIEPRAVIVSPPEVAGGAVILISRFQQDLFTFDSQPWRRGIGNEENAERAKMAVRAIGRCNALGVRHRDAKVKNVATSPTINRTGMIDFETSEFFDVSNPAAVAATVTEDFDQMLASLERAGYFGTANPRTSAEQATHQYDDDQLLRTVVGELHAAYVDCWKDAPADVQSAAYENARIVAQNLVDRHKRTPDALSL